MAGAARVRALPQAVADAIAAGEVVERPASVVKELCENALDAGATRVEVEFEGGGLVLIAVRDNGVGIAAEDLPLAVARHATSKIATAADLVHVRSLGFRGEALASIAAVSHLRLSSRPAACSAGSAVRVRAGEPLGVGVVAMAPGTEVEVAELFAATPARLRFLRSARAEAAAAVRVVTELALMRPDVAFTCRSEGRVVVRSPGGVLADATRAVFGTVSGQLLPVEDGGDIAVRGAISPPHGHRATRGGLILGVNGRRIHNRALLYAAEDAYTGLIPAGRHPFGVLDIILDEEAVDVNVHPAKREVRFREERRVFSAVQRACWSVLGGASMPIAGLEDGSAGLVLGERPSSGYGPVPSRGYGGTSQAGAQAGAPWARRPSAGEVDAALTLHLPASSAGTGAGPPQALRALGQAGREWLVASTGGDVVLIDPHAAHEKILYAELNRRWSARDGDPDGAGAHVQMLLVPAVIDCDPGQMERHAAHADLIAACGFELEVFGPGLLRCSAVPLGHDRGDVAALVGELLSALDDEGGGGEAGRRHRLSATVACHSAVRLGDALGMEEQQSLLDRLVITPGGASCPHGRPTMLRLEEATLRRAFGRPPE
ncbi:MAG: DNA mismatch repair endonuclease MutL [Candidatus Dormibacteria bacterium]